MQFHPPVSDVEHRKENFDLSEFPSQTSPDFPARFFVVRRHREEIPVNVKSHRLGQVTTQIKRREMIEVLRDATYRHRVQTSRRSSHFEVKHFSLSK